MCLLNSGSAMFSRRTLLFVLKEPAAVVLSKGCLMTVGQTPCGKAEALMMVCDPPGLKRTFMSRVVVQPWIANGISINEGIVLFVVSCAGGECIS